MAPMERPAGLYNSDTFYTYDATGNISSVVVKDYNGDVESTTSYQYNFATDSYSATQENGNGSVMGLITGSINTTTGSTSQNVQTFLNGDVIDDQQINTNEQGGVVDNVSGTNAQINFNEAAIDLADSTQATITGNGNTIELSVGDTI